MPRFSYVVPALATAVLAVHLPAQAVTPPTDWPQHSLTRPQPPVVTPGAAMLPVPPPSDAIVLFDGKSLANWESSDAAGKAATWTLMADAMQVKPGAGAIQTRRGFGDVQLHVEWMAPTPAHGEGQERGNSGVFLMGKYEVQVLDSYRSTTYPDGQASAIYGQFPPMVNASRAPGRWQSYDIVFHRPHFDEHGQLTVPARLTVLHNGIIVHEDAVLLGPTSHQVRSPYTAHPDKLPLVLQDHGSLVKFRNIWLRELPDIKPT